MKHSKERKERKKRGSDYQDPSLVDVVAALSDKKAASKPSRTRTRFRCKRCVNDFLCLSRRHSFKDKLLRLVGLKALRCEHCNRRYYRFTV